MTDLTLFHAVPSRSSMTLWMLEELGQPFELKVVNLAKGEQLTADYARINPLRKVPALRHKGVVITEVAAICTYLADEFPQARLNIPVGTPQRGIYLRWLFFGPSIFEPAVMDHNFKRAKEPPPTAVGWRPLPEVLDTIEAGLKDGPFLMGDRFTAADVVIGSGLRWGMMLGFVDKRPRFVTYGETLAARPALQRATDRDAAYRGDSA